MRHDCTFKIPKMGFWGTFFGKPLNFYGDGTITLQETGLVVHGELPMFLIPFIGRFYSRLLVEPTMRTVPYARIIQHKTTGRWISLSFLKVVFLLLWFVAVGGLLVLGSKEIGPTMAILLGVAAFLIIPVVILMFDRGTHYITYALPSGKRSYFSFRLKPLSAAKMTDFSNRLSEFQAAAVAFDDVKLDQEQKVIL